LTAIESKGRGHGVTELSSHPILFITHHAMSRAAQRLGMRTAEHMLEVATMIWIGTMDLMLEADSLDAWLAAPPAGWRVPIEGGGLVVLKRHEERHALLAATVLDSGDGAA
jgi:hypothetical protein